MFLGAVKAISIGDARKLASQIYIDVRAGKDPARDKIESQSAAAATIAAQELHRGCASFAQECPAAAFALGWKAHPARYCCAAGQGRARARPHH